MVAHPGLIRFVAMLALTAPAGARCIQANEIAHTEVRDDRTIDFHMDDRTVWRNVLTQTCPGLKFDTRGFTYEPTDPGSDEICDNLVTIRLNTYRTVCELGAFKPVPPPSPAAGEHAK